MRLNAKELIANARVTAPTLPPAEAKLMSDMADRLDVQYAVIRESREQVQKLAAESDFNLHGAARELNTSWMMHKTMMGAQAALLCLSQGDIRSARDWLEGTTDEAFIEMPDNMTPAGLQAWFDSNMTSNDGGNGFLTQEEALDKLRQRAPATVAAIAALRAEGAEMYAVHIAHRVSYNEGDKFFEQDAMNFAAQLRQSVQSVSPALAAPLSAAITDIIAERQRQQTVEGWTPEHDDEYEHGELADAAGCYALSSELFDCAGEPPRPWPWTDEWWKPTNRRRDLVKAGALIAAEIERIDRQAVKGNAGEGSNG